MRSTRVFTCLILLAKLELAFGYGFEKAIPFGGKAAGLAGIAAPDIEGADALFFNPAGLAANRIGHSLSLNVSPIATQFKGPVNDDSSQDVSERKILSPGSLMYSYTPTQKVGYGFGFYIPGGAQTKYADVTFSSPSNATGLEVSTDLTIYEVAVGAGFTVTDYLKVGMAYRIDLVEGGFKVAQRLGATTLANLHVEDLTGLHGHGLKLGAQYILNEKTRLALTYRSPIEIRVKGNTSGTVYVTGATLPIDENRITAKTTFPQALQLQASHMVNNRWTLRAGIDWTQYSKVEHVTLDGAITRSGGTVISSDAPDLEQGWRDQYNVRIASSYFGGKWPLHMGYVWTSQVANNNWARATFSPPGVGHTLIAGSEAPLGENLSLAMTAEYTWGDGEGNSNPASADIRAGTYEVESIGAHLGLSYLF